LDTLSSKTIIEIDDTGVEELKKIGEMITKIEDENKLIE